jgi:hypothetical protein
MLGICVAVSYADRRLDRLEDRIDRVARHRDF